MKKTITLITIMLIITTQLTIAENADPITQLQNTIIQEHIKTRLEMTKYADAKFSQYDEKIQKEIKPYIDENFKIFDDRMHALATQFIFQLTTAMFFAIILANAIWLVIKRSIERIRKKTNKTINKDELTMKKYGIITPEYLEKITKEDQTITKKPIMKDKDITPTSPSINQIEEMLKKKKEEENKKRLEEIKRLEEKAQQKTRRINQKIEELKKTITPETKQEITILPPLPPTNMRTENHA